VEKEYRVQMALKGFAYVRISAASKQEAEALAKQSIELNEILDGLQDIEVKYTAKTTSRD
jgi:hypothetical protein